MVFGKIIYYNKKDIDEYKSIITGKPVSNEASVESSKKIEGNIGSNLINVGGEITKTGSSIIRPSILLECRQFEVELHKSDDYIDMTLSDDYDIRTIPYGTIVKMSTYLSVPEEFDLYQMMSKFKPLLSNIISEKVENDGEKQAVEALFENTDGTTIPISLECNNNLLCSKIQSEYLSVDYNDLDEFEDEEIVVLLRMYSSGIVKASKPYYDPLKDFMKLNRAARKAFKDEKGELKPIYSDQDYRMVDILAIYK